MWYVVGYRIVHKACTVQVNFDVKLYSYFLRFLQMVLCCCLSLSSNSISCTTSQFYMCTSHMYFRAFGERGVASFVSMLTVLLVPNTPVCKRGGRASGTCDADLEVSRSVTRWCDFGKANCERWPRRTPLLTSKGLQQKSANWRSFQSQQSDRWCC